MERLARVCFCLTFIVGAGCFVPCFVFADQGSSPLAGKRVLLVNSYHPGYVWSDGIIEGARAVLEPQGVILKVFDMDTKRNQDEAFMEQAGRKAMAEVEAFRPDVVIASDDNAQRYLVVPYLVNGPIPVVFCGVNWDAAQYGYPAKNVTGMVEVEVVETLMNHLRRFANGDRVGFLSENNETERQVVDNYNRLFFNGRLRPYLVEDFAGFKEKFLAAQNDVDMLIISTNVSVKGWDGQEAERFVAENLRIPAGTCDDWMARYAVFTTSCVPQEQGEWAAGAAIRILQGDAPASIPLVKNEKARLIVNLKMAQASGIVVPVSTLKAASEVLGKDVLRGTVPAPAGMPSSTEKGANP